jgi:methionyl-tRNA formyltransferase
VVAVYSQPDRPAGRGRKLTASPVKAVATEHAIPVEQPLNFKSEESVTTLRSYNADIMVVVAYGIILPAVVLTTPRLGCINVHASILPRWRGAAPIHRALLAGDTKSGVTIMQMDAGLDTGDMLLVSECPIYAQDTSEQLHDRLIEIGQPALLTVLSQLENGTATPVKQDDSLANYAHKLEKSEGLINWGLSAEEIDCQIRGLTPWPGAYTRWQGQNVRIHKASLCRHSVKAAPGTIVSLSAEGFEVASNNGTLLLEVLQMPGKKAMPAKDILNARKAQFEETPVFGQ